VENVTLISDGAASQFKHYLFANFKESYEVTVSWHFFVTSHGEGVVDGVGGTIKREVWTTCKPGQHVVSSAEAFTRTTHDMA
jgi:hypothetical protein